MVTYLWGSGGAAKLFFASYPQNTIDAILDNDASKWGLIFFDREIKAPKNVNGDDHVIIAVTGTEVILQIFHQLLDCGVRENNIKLWIVTTKTVLSAPDLRQLLDLMGEKQSQINSYVHENLLGLPKYSRSNRHEFLSECFLASPNEGLLAEFGVFEGKSIKLFASLTDRKIYGFDSFEGLPEYWNISHPKGIFDLNGKVPSVPGNVEFVVGLFDKTLNHFLDTHDENFSFIHIDSDLYSSAKYVLDCAKHRIVKGTIIVFDEFFSDADEIKDERDAFEEFVVENNVRYEFVAWSHTSVCVRITDKLST